MSEVAQSEELEFYQRRVARFGLAMFLLSALGVVLRIVVFSSVVVSQEADLSELGPWGSWITHLLGLVPFAVMYLYCRGAPKPESVIQHVELVGMFVASCSFVGMGLFIPGIASPDLVVAMILTQLLVVRAAMVPSSPRRTLTLAIAVGVAFVTGAYFMYADPVLTGDFAEEQKMLPPAIIGVVSSASWWTMTTLISTLISRVIFGLRREVRTAQRLGQYTLEQKLGEGGMGVVYQASHAMLRRPTAVKLLSAERAGKQNIARFEREVQLTAQLTHPNTITIFDYGRTPDGTFYYAMELLDGATLDEVVEVDGPQPAGRVVHVLAQVAGALVEAHERGLIHRDIKPANVMLCEQGGIPDVAKVLDFGLVKEQTPRDPGVTGDQTLIGTPLYMAPEAVTDANAVDARSDLYAVGAVAYFLLTGEHVFSGNTPVEVLSKHLHEEPVSPSKRLGGEVPAPLEQLVLDCLAKSPDDRPPSAAILLNRARDCIADAPWEVAQADAWWSKRRGELEQASPSRGDRSRTIGIALDDRFAGFT